jgi:hypothetical protein
LITTAGNGPVVFLAEPECPAVKAKASTTVTGTAMAVAISALRREPARALPAGVSPAAGSPAGCRGESMAIAPCPSEMDDGTGQRASDTAHALDPGHDQPAELVDVAGLSAHDHVVGPGDVLGEHHAGDRGYLGSHRGRLAHLGLNQDVGMHGGCWSRSPSSRDSRRDRFGHDGSFRRRWRGLDLASRHSGSGCRSAGQNLSQADERRHVKILWSGAVAPSRRSGD